MSDKIKPEPMLGGHSRGSTCMQSFLHPVTLPALFRESAGSSLLMLLPKEDLSQTVRTWELCDLWLLRHVFRGHSGTAFISATLALLHLNFSDSSPASCYHRPAQPIREFTLETFHLHHAKLCTYTGHSLFQGRSSIGLGIVKISTVVLLLPIQLIDPGRSFILILQLGIRQ